MYIFYFKLYGTDNFKNLTKHFRLKWFHINMIV
jgi:hypothetical protein